jgi:hypothetical protein
MSTVAEIKEAIDRLREEEQVELCSWLEERLAPDWDTDPENVARIQKKLDEVDPTKCREWTEADWARLRASV